MKEYDKVKQWMEQYHMVEKNDSVIVGVSGGADSVCLLDMLDRMKKEKDDFCKELVVVHVNHGIRGEEALRDEQFVSEMCRIRGIRLIVRRFAVPAYAKEHGLSQEEAGRILRYLAFDGVAEELRLKTGTEGKIAVAHNAKDSVETWLHNLCRGAGLSGLTGIHPVNGSIIRPVLCLSREEIESYLADRKLSYVDDSTNGSEQYLRNRIRHLLMPYLTEQINAGAVRHIGQTAQDIAQAEAYIEKQASLLYEQLFVEEQDCVWVDRQAFAALEELMKRRLVRRAVAKTAGKLKDIQRRHIEDVLLLAQNRTGSRLMLPYGVNVRIEYDKMIVSRERNRLQDIEKESAQEAVPLEKESAQEAVPLEKESAQEAVPLEKEGVYQWGHLLFRITLRQFGSREEIVEFLENYLKNPQKMYTKCFDYDRISNVALLRTRKTGDYLVINGQGDRKKLKSYWIDEKVPAADRDRIPCVADGSHIMWIYGYRVSEYYKVTENTRRVMIVSAEKQEGQNERRL